MMLAWKIWIALGLITPACGVAAAQLSADLVLSGGKVWTLDERQPEVEAVAVWQGRILATGNSNEIRLLIGPKTRVVELKGRRVLPGVCDCHVHLLSGGLQLRRVDLKDAADEAEFGRRLKAFDRSVAAGPLDAGRKLGSRSREAPVSSSPRRSASAK